MEEEAVTIAELEKLRKKADESVARFSKAFAEFKVRIEKDFESFCEDEKAVREILAIKSEQV